MTGPLLTSAEIADAFHPSLPRIRTTRMYRARLLLVLLGLIVLQVLYLALIAAVILLTCWYVIASFSFNLSFNGLSIIVYLGPPLAGLIAVIFLIKPIAIRPPRPPEPLQLSRDEEPGLFEFIDRLCDALGSPRPSRVFANLDINASASLRGWRGFFLGHLDLTIGLPLVADFPLAAFAGVLAHEFGHFGQRAGMRSSFLIHSIQRWFARVVYQRDSLDVWLEEHREGGDYRIRAVAMLATLVVGASRRYLALLMHAGAWLGSGLSRQMEFDADRYQAALAGVEMFEHCFHRLQVLELSGAITWKEVNRLWSSGQLPEDISALVAARAKLFTGDAVQELITNALAQKAGRWDTHPSFSDRITSVQQEGQKGILRIHGSATRLFCDLQALGRRTTWHHYETFIQITPDRTQLLSIEESIGQMRDGAEFDAAAQKLFGASAAECCQWLRLPPCPSPQPPLPVARVSEFHAAVRTNSHHYVALQIREAGVPVNRSNFELDSTEIDYIREVEAASRRSLTEFMDRLNSGVRPIAEKIHEAIAHANGGNNTVHNELHQSWACYCEITNWRQDLYEVRRRMFAAQIVRGNATLFPAARCANLLDQLEGEAEGLIERMLARNPGLHAPIQFDPSSPRTLGGQFRFAGPITDRISIFVSRVDATAARALAYLAWRTIQKDAHFRVNGAVSI